MGISPISLQLPPDKITSFYKPVGKQYRHEVVNTENCNICQTGIVISPNGCVRPCIPFPLSTKESLFSSSNFETVLNESNVLHKKYYVFDSECIARDNKAQCACPIIISLFGKNKQLRCTQTKNSVNSAIKLCEHL